MTCPAPTTAELAALRAELAASRARAEQLEATVHVQARTVADLAACLASRAGAGEAVTAPPSRSTSVTDTVTAERDASRSERHAASVTHHAPSVTAEEKKARARELAAARSRTWRRRQALKRSVTAERDGVTPNVMKEEEKKEVVTPPPPSLVTQASVTAVTRDAPPTTGRLRLEQYVAARQARLAAATPGRRPPPPPEVVALGEAWEGLVVASGCGFAPWPERMSARFVQDALAALQRRPLEEWRRVFALVPRSPLCRGELRSKRHADVLWLLSAETSGGYEPAEKLLTGAWTVDPEPYPSNADPKPEPLAEAPPGDTSPPAEAWRRVRALLAEQGKRYTLDQLEPLRPHTLAEGWLVVLARDRFQRAWVGEHYGELLRQLAEQCGFAGVRVDVAGEGGP